jgi:hypothetical protein
MVGTDHAQIDLTVTWTVAFTDLEPARHWVSRALGWLRPGMRHVLAFRQTPGGVLIVQQTAARLQVDVAPFTTAEALAASLVAGGATLLDVRVPADDSVPVLRGLTCVGVTRALLGMRGRPFQTPAGLARQLGVFASPPSGGYPTSAATGGRGVTDGRKASEKARIERRAERPCRGGLQSRG